MLSGTTKCSQSSTFALQCRQKTTRRASSPVSVGSWGSVGGGAGTGGGVAGVGLWGADGGADVSGGTRWTLTKVPPRSGFAAVIVEARTIPGCWPPGVERTIPRTSPCRFSCGSAFAVDAQNGLLVTAVTSSDDVKSCVAALVNAPRGQLAWALPARPARHAGGPGRSVDTSAPASEAAASAVLP